jgi:hypothetical protein
LEDQAVVVLVQEPQVIPVQGELDHLPLRVILVVMELHQETHTPEVAVVAQVLLVLVAPLGLAVLVLLQQLQVQV